MGGETEELWIFGTIYYVKSEGKDGEEVAIETESKGKYLW